MKYEVYSLGEGTECLVMLKVDGVYKNHVKLSYEEVDEDSIREFSLRLAILIANSVIEKGEVQSVSVHCDLAEFDLGEYAHYGVEYIVTRNSELQFLKELKEYRGFCFGDFVEGRKPYEKIIGGVSQALTKYAQRLNSMIKLADASGSAFLYHSVPLFAVIATNTLIATKLNESTWAYSTVYDLPIVAHNSLETIYKRIEQLNNPSKVRNIKLPPKLNLSGLNLIIKIRDWKIYGFLVNDGTLVECVYDILNVSKGNNWEEHVNEFVAAVTSDLSLYGYPFTVWISNRKYINKTKCSVNVYGDKIDVVLETLILSEVPANRVNINLVGDLRKEVVQNLRNELNSLAIKKQLENLSSADEVVKILVEGLLEYEDMRDNLKKGLN